MDMFMAEEDGQATLVLTAQIVSAHVSNNSVEADALPASPLLAVVWKCVILQLCAGVSGGGAL